MKKPLRPRRRRGQISDLKVIMAIFATLTALLLPFVSSARRGRIVADMELLLTMFVILAVGAFFFFTSDTWRHRRR